MKLKTDFSNKMEVSQTFMSEQANDKIIRNLRVGK